MYTFFLAVGCETFADGSSIIILNKTNCEENSECLGENEIDLTKTRCTLLLNQTEYLYNDTWTPLEMKNGSLTIAVNNKTSLKVYQTFNQCKIYSFIPEQKKGKHLKRRNKKDRQYRMV